MAALAVAQPNDAVDFLGKWLLRYAETEEARIETAKQEAEFKAAREKKQAELVAEAERLKQIEDDKAAKLKARGPRRSPRVSGSSTPSGCPRSPMRPRCTTST